MALTTLTFGALVSDPFDLATCRMVPVRNVVLRETLRQRKGVPQ